MAGTRTPLRWKQKTNPSRERDWGSGKTEKKNLLFRKWFALYELFYLCIQLPMHIGRYLHHTHRFPFDLPHSKCQSLPLSPQNTRFLLLLLLALPPPLDCSRFFPLNLSREKTTSTTTRGSTARTQLERARDVTRRSWNRAQDSRSPENSDDAKNTNRRHEFQRGWQMASPVCASTVRSATWTVQIQTTHEASRGFLMLLGTYKLSQLLLKSSSNGGCCAASSVVVAALLLLWRIASTLLRKRA